MRAQKRSLKNLNNLKRKEQKKMKNQELERSHEDPRQAQLFWALKILSELLNVPKKHLRKAFNIMRTPELKAVIIEKGGPVERTFFYGFRRFFRQEAKKQREILAPHPDVQLVLRAVKDLLDVTVGYHDNTFGFRKGRNCQKAVMTIFRSKHFISFDIANAFPSITMKMVEKSLEKLWVGKYVTEAIAWITTYNYNGERRLPQGSAVSPSLLNLVYIPMCIEIDKFCKKHKIKWIVYADDFTFASKNDIPLEIKNALMAIPVKYGFIIKEEKTKDNLGKTIAHILGRTIVVTKKRTRSGKTLTRRKIHIRRKNKNEYRRKLHAAIKFGAYSPGQVRGIIGAIRAVYGSEKNWPGCLRRQWKTYQIKEEVEKNAKTA